MSATTQHSGSCLCGAVTLTVEVKSDEVDACHCSLCRRWGGGPLLAIEGAGHLELQGEENVSVYASSEWAERGFCRHCGTHLFYRLKSGEHHAVPVGLVDQGHGWHFATQIFIDEKPGYYAFANETHDMTGDQVFAAFNAGDGS
ncbi:Uncharacterized conserved protein [Franzmannia pantelleriensis]|uniref:Uncharacterized conserved protein n=1 Tax=Franzmannia pantelleriensis TaxID=48727 RepID=A0A1G9R2G7_9GAMM|nr:GFA family protein [Halomonas pantelleriensis]SDM17331.1 Uncharacterized conserved protein [Halomonas pantelleriensis]